ncbi:malto-oligosyltrehalose synthase [Pontibacter harenae]|uniref:malto-oligosyltrehalose synthase n=1 Tax=Pontibacter harenae TaxID=2894083 RepID=UPI001E5AE4AC|nr:malto-oligosyltrehalose synthase [Pontibacter harenae]MCC9166291.1 malto-oligosyltrehalose synthase [Pontibacter harenae]
MVYIPSATYRLQISPKFKLKEVKKLIPYLHELGISTIYSAPFFSATPGSEHGYDVINPLEINPDTGTLEELREIAEELKKYNMGWLQDIVPNHMAYHPKNQWLMEVLELGPASNFYNFFDINFDHPDFKGKLMIPFLGEPLEKVVEQGQVEIKFSGEGLQAAYFENVYPLNIASYTYLLEQAAEKLENEDAKKVLQEQLQQLQMLENEKSISTQGWRQTKQQFFSLVEQQKELRQAIEQQVKQLNEDKQALLQLLDRQYFQLAFWKETLEHINFRRFFTVNDLICLQMERKEVFDQYHQFIKQLCEENLVQGLRVDHVDGLYDPDTYLERLRAMAGEEQYLVVEKILEGEEEMPQYWPIQGNSGYDFLAWVSNLFTAGDGEKKLNQVYKRLVPDASINYENLVFDKKQFILHKRMAGELQNLLRLLQESELIPQDNELDKWRRALSVLLSSFPVYRIYGHSFPLPPEAMEVIEQAFTEARKRGPEVTEQLDHLRTIFEAGEQDSEEQKKNKLYFVLRSQQFTGPLAAKGVEDTTFYNYNRLISLNEVGNSPEIFHLGANDFHGRMQYRLRSFPHSINATATHDTKRGEDATTRLSVLSEVTEDWEEHVKQWFSILQNYADADEPSKNDLYFVFQTLIGVMPMNGEIDHTLVERVQEYLVKALREAKVHTNWNKPNEQYEQEVCYLVQRLLEKEQSFIKSFLPFFQKVAHYGWLYSLCQTLLKVTCPGVPDMYQGTELWDLSLVDPDNRRPVDYEQRQQYLTELKEQEQQNAAELHKKLVQNPDSGRVKFYTLCMALNARKQLQDLFNHGDYQPLTVTGKHKANIMAFARQHEGQWCLVVVPRLIVRLVPEQGLPLGEEVWEDTAIALPENAPTDWQQVYGGTTLSADNSLPVSKVLETFPVALLTAKTA